MSSITRRDFLKTSAVLAGASPLAKLVAQPSDPQSFQFVFFSDTHVGLKNNIPENTAMLAEIAAVSPAFAINGGDITDYGWPGEFDNYHRLIDGLKFPVHPTAGNHDVRWSPQGVKLFRERLGEPYTHFEHLGVHFFILDSTVPLSHWGHYEAEQLRWLEHELKQVGRSAPIFIATHHWVGRDSVMVDNEEALRRIIEPYNIKIILNGHGHSDLLWNWDGVVGTMNKGLYQGSWEWIEVDQTAGNIRMSRRTNAQHKPKLISTVALIPDPAKRPVWATGNLPLERAYEEAVASGAEIRSCYGPWLKASDAPSLALLAGRAQGEQVIELRDPKSGFQSTYTHTNPGDKLALKWRSTLTGGVMSHLKLSGDQLFVSAMDGSLSALDAGSGKLNWRSKTGRYCHSSPVVDGELVFVGSADASFYCFDRTTGKQVWRAETQGPVYASAAIAGNVVCVASGDGHFYGLDRGTGALKWKYEMPASNTAFAQSHATTDGTRFYIGAWDSHLYSIDAQTGELAWRMPCFPRTFAWSPAIGGPAFSDGKVFVPANGNGLFCFDAATGEQRWMVSSRTDKYGHSSPRIEGGYIYVGCLGDLGEIRCLSASDGTERWVGRTGSVIYDSSPAIGEGFVAIGSVGSLLSVFDKSSGSLIEQVRLPVGHFLASPVARGNQLFAATYSNTVSCFGLGG